MRGVPVVVTGLGPVSAIGCGRNAFWEALQARRHGIGPITLCDTGPSPSKIGAEVKGFRLDTYVENGDILGRHTPRPVQLGLAASVLALHDAACVLRNLPVGAFHGARDPVVSLKEDQEMVDALRACGGDAKFSVYPDAWTLAYEDPALYDWLLAHRRAAW
jgi:3-oxoacyl-(acyl-carrier-protein) synthase